MVGAELVPDPLAAQQLDLVIRNYGPTIARDLEVSLAPDPIILPGDPREPRLASLLVQRYQQVVPNLMPGAVLRNAYYVGGLESGANLEPLPDEFTVTLTYRDAERRRKPYRDVFHVAIPKHETFTRPGRGNNPEERRLDALDAIARGIGRH